MGKPKKTSGKKAAKDLTVKDTESVKGGTLKHIAGVKYEDITVSPTSTSP